MQARLIYLAAQAAARLITDYVKEKHIKQRRKKNEK
jgi:hypothetical protein